MASAADEAVDDLLAAVAALKVEQPTLTAKEVHTALLRMGWADASISQVKKACARVGKQAAGKQAAEKKEADRAAAKGKARKARRAEAAALPRRGDDALWHAELFRQGLATRSAEEVCRDGPVDSGTPSRFLAEYMAHFASFAAVKYQNSGKGALFVLSRIAYADLMDLDEELRDDLQPWEEGCAQPGPRGACALDRQFLLVWGTQDWVPGAPFTAAELCADFAAAVDALPSRIGACSESAFPIVICCDPSGRALPQKLRDVEGALRLARRPPATAAYEDEGLQVFCGSCPFMDFESLVSTGELFGYDEQDVTCLNMDRHIDDPQVT